MKQIAVISGKGGTGKTSIAAALASCARSCVLADCDVDASNLHLIISPQNDRFLPIRVRSGYEFLVDEDYCTSCGECGPVCRFDAIHFEPAGESGEEIPIIDPFACEGCGCCADVCPVEAISMREKEIGYLYQSSTRFGPMVHAQLDVAQSNSGKLVTMVRQKATEFAEREGRQWIIIDGSPGIGCPVIASITGVDLAIIVTEPSQSGLHDFNRIADLNKHFSIPTGVIINKFNLNDNLTTQIKEEVSKRNLQLLGLIPYNEIFFQSMVRQQTVVEHTPSSEIATTLQHIWKRLTDG